MDGIVKTVPFIMHIQLDAKVWAPLAKLHFVDFWSEKWKKKKLLWQAFKMSNYGMCKSLDTLQSQ